MESVRAIHVSEGHRGEAKVEPFQHLPAVDHRQAGAQHCQVLCLPVKSVLVLFSNVKSVNFYLLLFRLRFFLTLCKPVHQCEAQFHYMEIKCKLQTDPKNESLCCVYTASPCAELK